MGLLTIGMSMLFAASGATPAMLQSDVERELLRRVERLERRVEDLERESRRSDYSRPAPSRPSPRREVTAAVSLLCGADCGMAARSYCKRTGYENGVAITIEKKGAFDHVTRARCFN